MSVPTPVTPVLRSRLILGPAECFELAKVRFEDHVTNLRAMTGFDLQLFGGYLTIQLGLGAWLADPAPQLVPLARGGLFLIDTILAFVAWYMLHLSARRRQEVVASLKHVKAALRLEETDLFLHDLPLDAKSHFRPWKPIYTGTIILSWIGMAMIIWADLLIAPR